MKYEEILQKKEPTLDECEAALKQFSAREHELRAASDRLDAKYAEIKLHGSAAEIDELRRQGREIQIELEHVPMRVAQLIRLQEAAEIREAPARAAVLYKRFRKLLPQADEARATWLKLREELQSLAVQLGHQKGLARDGKLKSQRLSENELTQLLKVLDVLGPKEQMHGGDLDFRIRVSRAAKTRSQLLDEDLEQALVDTWRALGFELNSKKGTLKRMGEIQAEHL